MSRFDRALVAVVLALGLLIGGLSLASAQLGPSPDSVSMASALDGISVNTQIAVTFTEPMNHLSVERHFHLSPTVPGDFSWSSNELFFTPRHPLAYGTTYLLAVDQAAKGVDGRTLTHGIRRHFTTQTQHLLYLGTSGDERGNLVLASVTGQRQIVGVADGGVTNFSVSLDGSLAVYVHRGSDRQPDEIWLLSLADNSTQRIFSHPGWVIDQPHLSPDGSHVVFLATNVRLCQRYYGCYLDRSGPVVFLLDIHTHQARQFSANQDTPLTSFIAFSPAGQIAFTDMGSALTLADPSGSHILHIPDRGNSLVFWGFDDPGDKAEFVGQTPSSTGGDVLVYEGSKYVDISQGVYDSSTPAFSTSGRAIAYAGYHGELGIEPIYGINVYSFKTRKTVHLTGEKRWSDWAPAWSLDDRYIAFVRSQPQEAMYMGAGEVWVMRADGSDAHPLGGIGEDIQWVS